MTTTAVRPVDRILDKLKYNGSRPLPSYKCRCPAHDDNKESLNVKEGDDGKVLLKCFAGCSAEKIVTAVGLKMADLFPAGEKPARNKTVLGPIICEYNYTDAYGQLSFQATRHKPKDFRQRRPNGKGGWINDLKGVELVPYHLPLLQQATPDEWVFIVEGEKDVENLECGGVHIVATCNPMGAGKWRDSYSQYFKGLKVCILPDNDEPGRNHAQQVARSLVSVATEVRILELPGLPEKGDVSDWLAPALDACPIDNGEALEARIEELLELVEATPTYIAPIPNSQDPYTNGNGAGSHKQAKKGEEKKPQSTVVYELARERMKVFVAPSGEPYAEFEIDNHWETHPLRSSAVRNFLGHIFHELEGKIPGSQAKQDALSLLEFDASRTKREVFTRVAHHAGKVYIDLANDEWQAIEVDENGWRIVPQPPVAFRRSKGMEALPYPTTGGDVSLLRSFVNIEPIDWPLLVAWVLAALYPSGPYPILLLTGEQGSTKSTTARVIKELVDPNAAKLRGQPTDVRDLIIAAQNSRVLAYDNISSVNAEISDALCRVSTGGGYTTRSLYTDTDEVVINVQRPVILTGISDFVTRPDLMDRAIPINLPAMAETKRRDEATFWRDFGAARPQLLGAFLDVLVWTISALPHTILERMPRMADFAKIAVAAEPALGLTPGEFLSRYAENRSEGAATILDSSPIISAIKKLVMIPGQWTGTSSALLEALEQQATERDRNSKLWPQSPNKLTSEIKRLAPVLRQLEIVDAVHKHSKTGAQWEIKRLAKCVSG
jgi:hypothetical protein